MRLTLSEILRRVGGYVDQDSSSDPTGTDLTDRTNYANRALDEWASAYDWNSLTLLKEFSVGASQTSFGLDTNFRKPMSAPYEYNTDPATPYTIIPRDERFRTESNKKISYLDGNTAGGWALIVPVGLATGASFAMDVQIYPSGYATFTDISVIPDAEFIVDRTIAYVLEARSDSRFPSMQSSADRRLATMLEQQNAGNAGQINTVPKNTSFVIGVS